MKKQKSSSQHTPHQQRWRAGPIAAKSSSASSTPSPTTYLTKSSTVIRWRGPACYPRRTRSRFCSQYLTLIDDAVQVRIKKTRVRDIRLCVEVSLFIFIVSVYFYVRVSNMYRLPLLQTNLCKLWKNWTDEQIMGFLNQDPKFLDNVPTRCKCGTERREAIERSLSDKKRRL